jgi:hypothetical protein
MPAFVKVLALGLPTFHFGELARAAVGLGEQSALLSVGGLVAWGVVGVLLAGWGLRRRPY